MPFSAWLVDPLARGTGDFVVAALGVVWLVISVVARRRSHDTSTLVVAALVLLALTVLTGKFVTLSALGRQVTARPLHVGDNQGTLIDVTAEWETPRGDTIELRGSSPVVHVSYPANSHEQQVFFMVLTELPVVHDYGHRAMIANWRVLAAVLVLLSFSMCARWFPVKTTT